LRGAGARERTMRPEPQKEKKAFYAIWRRESSKRGATRAPNGKGRDSSSKGKTKSRNRNVAGKKRDTPMVCSEKKKHGASSSAWSKKGELKKRRGVGNAFIGRIFQAKNRRGRGISAQGPVRKPAGEWGRKGAPAIMQ